MANDQRLIAGINYRPAHWYPLDVLSTSGSSRGQPRHRLCKNP